MKLLLAVLVMIAAFVWIFFAIGLLFVGSRGPMEPRIVAEGMRAYHANVSSEANPHTGNPARGYWLNGWIEASEGEK